LFLSFFCLLVSSNSFVAFWVFSLMSLKNLRKDLVSDSSMLFEQVRPSSLMVARSASLSISSYLVSSIYWTWNISLFFSINVQRSSLFLGLSIGMVKPAASATLTLLWTFGLIANYVGSMSVSQIFLRQPSLVGLFFSHILSCLFFSLSITFLSFSVSLKENISSSDGSLNGFSPSSP